ncbi:MAG: KamA family radical SAM protein [Nitrospirota bacterium]
MSDQWKYDLRDSLEAVEDLVKRLGLAPREAERLRDVVARYPMRITPHVLGTIRYPGDPIWLQVVPTAEEVDLQFDMQDDPLNEEGDMVVPHLVHRYPDRVLLFVTNQCPIYCRFCTRKRFVGSPGGTITPEAIDVVAGYIRAHPEIRDIIFSGGDPLLLVDSLLERVLSALRTIPHLEIIRIGSRVPGTLPSRITPDLCAMLKRYHPLYMNLHFNHPDELTPEVEAACGRLADAGIPLGSQTVLLKGINDDPDTMKRLVQKLLKARVKPYYLYQADLVTGTNQFRTPVETGLAIIRALHGHTSGMAIPRYVIDAPGGGGKVTVMPQDFVLELNSREVILKNYEDQVYRYPQVRTESVERRDLDACGDDPASDPAAAGRLIPLRRSP